ncbi:serine/threonine-protein kinase [Acidobacteria bacterium AH-259-D05]|nr:serine/threonine-protein kinase [Acidobacteria bacterium AH-259-D05]
MIGKTLSHYKVLEKIGQGGMGEVYRAEDTNLNREVAIKVLPEQFTQDPQRLARFEREAKLLASLNHPNIAAIHSFEHSDDVHFLVLELVPGETLAERVAKGPLPVEEALEVCRQIAEGVEAAHEKGVIHRDLKPANVKVTPEGKVKILDFGLAKAFEGETPVTDISQSPTLTEEMTRAGVILGTAAYMSPEQAKGKPVDKRADIFAFGAVLYELLTGKRAFEGETITETIAAVLKSDPDWEVLPENTPWNICTLLRRCLQKDANDRFHHVADVRIEIKEALKEPATAPPIGITSAVQPPLWKRAIPWSITVTVVLIAAIAIWSLTRPTPEPITRFALTLTEQLGSTRAGLNENVVALSPDGKRLVYVTVQGLYLRPMDSLQASPIPGTEEALSAFFSPDGQWVGFFTDGELKKVSISGGVPLTLCDAAGLRGASWGTDNTIVFEQIGAGLSQVSAGGGTPWQLTTLDSETGETDQVHPQILPGGKAVLFISRSGGSLDNWQIVVQSPETGERRVSVQGTYARYVPTGQLVYAQAGTPGTLLAVPFDVEHLEVTGAPVPIVEGVLQSAASGLAQFSFSDLGALVYVPGGTGTGLSRLVWVDRQGTAEPLAAPPRLYRGPSLSPDGGRVAVTITEPKADIWVYEIARQTLTRLTFEGSENQQPQWTPDGQRVTWRSIREGVPGNLFWKRADGTGAVERLTTSEFRQNPGSWSPDGQFLAFHQRLSTGSSPTERDIWILPLEGERKPRPFLQAQFNELGPVFSPDGRWLVYVSDESGRYEIYVRPFPKVEEGKWQISTDGGVEPRWAANGRELFYRNEIGDQMRVVEITTEPTFRAGTPKLLFEGIYQRSAGGSAFYDVRPDGQRFLMIQAGEQGAGAAQINVVLNWFEELNRLVPTN